MTYSLYTVHQKLLQVIVEDVFTWIFETQCSLDSHRTYVGFCFSFVLYFYFLATLRCNQPWAFQFLHVKLHRLFTENISCNESSQFMPVTTFLRQVEWWRWP